MTNKAIRAPHYNQGMTRDQLAQLQRGDYIQRRVSWQKFGVIWRVIWVGRTKPPGNADSRVVEVEVVRAHPPAMVRTFRPAQLRNYHKLTRKEIEDAHCTISD